MPDLCDNKCPVYICHSGRKCLGMRVFVTLSSAPASGNLIVFMLFGCCRPTLAVTTLSRASAHFVLATFAFLVGFLFLSQYLLVCAYFCGLVNTHKRLLRIFIFAYEFVLISFVVPLLWVYNWHWAFALLAQEYR